MSPVSVDSLPHHSRKLVCSVIICSWQIISCFLSLCWVLVAYECLGLSLHNFFLMHFGDFVIEHTTHNQVAGWNTVQINLMQKSKVLLNSFSSKCILQIFTVKEGSTCKMSWVSTEPCISHVSVVSHWSALVEPSLYADLCLNAAFVRIKAPTKYMDIMW